MQMQAGMAYAQQGWGNALAGMNVPGLNAMQNLAGFGMPPAPSGGIGPGRQVLVAWSDGNKYPATVTQVNGNQANLVFPNGQTMWVELRHLTPA
jgi:hypothetical protein